MTNDRMIISENDVVDNNGSIDMIIVCNVYMIKYDEHQTEIMHYTTVH